MNLVSVSIRFLVRAQACSHRMAKPAEIVRIKHLAGLLEASSETHMRDQGPHRDLFDLVPLGSVVAYVLAALLVVAATVLRWGFELFDQEVASLAPFYLAVLFAVLIGGRGPGVFATLLGGVIVWWAFIPPRFSFDLSLGNAINLLMYLAGCALMVWGIEHYRLFKRTDT